MKVGDTGYIKLEEFDPPWWQALMPASEKARQEVVSGSYLPLD